jgi:hypothetical protein
MQDAEDRTDRKPIAACQWPSLNQHSHQCTSCLWHNHNTSVPPPFSTAVLPISLTNITFPSPLPIRCTRCSRYSLRCMTTVTIQPCPSSKQAVDRSVAALKRCACDFMGQLRSSGDQQKTDDDAGLSYLESAEAYKYDTLAIGRMIAQ